MPRPIRATIDLEALGWNLARVRRAAGARRVWAVAKANAYGHGLERALGGFRAADGLAVLDLDEAQRARAWGWTAPILLLEGLFEPADLAEAIGLALTPVVHCDEQVAMIAAGPRGTNGHPPLDIHLKIDTGMGRLGFPPHRVPSVLQRLAGMNGVRVAALMTHLANSDVVASAGGGPAPAVAEQLDRFAAAAQGWAGERSIANSAALLLQAGVGGDWVRPGIALYGATPSSAASASSLGLKPAMILESRLIAVQDVATGATVGYGGRWRAPRSMRVGVVACGYADGYPRSARDGTPVLVDGVRVALAGRVSMDMLTVDLDAAPRAGVGAHVELWGRGVAIDDVAAHADTVGYELMCALAPRVPVVCMRPAAP